MKVEVKKLTDVKLLQLANSFTTGRDSKMTLATAYKHSHSPIRTQLFWVECTDIPLFVASQLVRSHVGVQHFQRTKRTDRGGEDFRQTCEMYSKIINAQVSNIEEHLEDDWLDENSLQYERQNLRATADGIKALSERFDRYAPTDIAFIINAEALINMAHKRLCAKASKETRDLMTQIGLGVAIEDADLAEHLVPQCIFRNGICPEPHCCGWIFSGVGEAMRERYVNQFTNHK